MAIIAFHLDRNGKVVGVAKPEFVGVKIFEFIPIYLGRRVNSVLVLIDQENYGVNELMTEIEDRLKGHGITIEGRRDEDRLVVYDCSRGGRRFRLIVDGLDDIPFGRHMVEDHLLRAAKILLAEKVDDVF